MGDVRINRIFIMLGPKCNLNCKYCAQHDLDYIDPSKVDLKVKEFLEKHSKRNDRKLAIVFYGGEPLIYWDAIKDIVENTEGNIAYGMITNGKLLDEGKIEYINKHNMAVTISWDGINSEQVRGYDVIKENQLILNINFLGLSAVLSSYTYPLDFLNAAEIINRRYKKLHNHDIRLNIDTIMDLCNNCEELRKMDCNKIERQMRYVINHKDEVSSYKSIFNHLGRNYINSKKRSIITNRIIASDKDEELNKLGCQNGKVIWNVDKEGNIYKCHNSSDILGTVDDDEEEILNTVLRIDKVCKNYRNRCKDCFVEPLCRGGCPIVSSEDREGYYCRIKMAYYSPIIEYFMLK